MEITHELLLRYSEGNVSEKEEEYIKEWLQVSVENQKSFETIRDLADYTDDLKLMDSINIGAEWKKNQDRIAILQDKTKWPTLSHWMAIAAAITVIIVSAIVIRQNLISNIELIATDRQITEYQLSDGSLIDVNLGSKVVFPENFDSRSRKLTLDGEAFFDVKRDINRPFTIDLGKLTVHVLGTSFNVNAYSKSDIIEVVVKSGQVRLEKAENEDAIILGIGSKGIFNKTTGELIKVLNTDVNYLSWKTKRFIFRNSGLNEVVATLNRAYYETIQLENNRIGRCKLSAQFQDKSLEGILDIIGLTMVLEIERTSNGYTISGTGCE